MHMNPDKALDNKNKGLPYPCKAPKKSLYNKAVK